MRKILAVLLCLFLNLSLTGLARAQVGGPPTNTTTTTVTDVSPEMKDFVAKMRALRANKDVKGAVALIEAKPKLATDTFNTAVKKYPNLADDDKRFAVVLCNTIA